MTDKERTKRIDKSQLRVLFNVPFFAPGMAKLPVRFDDDPAITTAATNGGDIVFSRKWVDGLDDKYLPTVICHEVAHCLLGHLWRAPAGCDWDLWNQACDHAVNNMLKSFSEMVIGKRGADPFPFPDPQEQWCMNPGFKGMSEEQIYNILSAQKGGGGGGGKGGKGGGGSGKPGTGNPPPFGQMTKPSIKPGQSPQQAAAQHKQAASEWKNTMAQSAMMGKGRGDMPGGVERDINELLNPKVPWYEVLRHLLREQAEDDWNWMKSNWKFADSGFILPALDSENMGPVVFATDTSGSIDETILKHFQSEKQGCLDDMKPSKLVDIYCDSKIHKIAEYRRGETIDRKAPGGGGTDFRPVFEHIGKQQESVKCLVYLTDLDGSFPAADPGYPVIWVAYNCGNKKAPFGETIHVN